MKLKLLLIFAVLFVTAASAQTFSVGGVNYSVISTTNNTVGVTSSASYVGELIVPSTVQNAGVTYTVVSILDAAFQNSTTLTSITIPNTVTEIRNNAFRFCTNLTSVDMGNSITNIGQLSFNACFSLTSVVIPSSVTNISINAFQSCNTLTSVTVGWATPLPINSNVFTNVNIGAATLNVPSGTIASYQAAPVWQDFGTISPPPPATHLNLDGINDYVELPNESNFDFTNEMTVELWMNSSVMPQQWDALVVKGDDSWRLHLNASGTVNFACNGVTPTQEINSTTSITDGNWHHIAATLGGDSIKIYVDGVLENQASASGIINNNVHTVLIGNNPIYSGRNFTGHMDDIRIWNVSRSAEQINGSKNCELQGNETGLVAYYNFNQGYNEEPNTSINSLIDATANANNGILTNFALTGSTSNWLAGSPIESGSIIPSVPTVTSLIQYAQNDTSSQLTATSGGTGLLWYTSETDGTGSEIAPTPDTTTIGSTSYWVTSTNANGCESERLEIIIEVAVPADHYHIGANSNGATNVISINGSSVGLDLPNTFTVELWAKTSGFFPIFIGYDEEYLSMYYFFTIDFDNKLSFQIKNFIDHNEVFVSNQTISDNVWYHIALSRDSSNTYSFYIDGVLDSTFTPMVPIEEFNIEQIGSGNNTAIDEYRVWDLPRTEEQINANKNCELQGTESGLLIYYKFNQGLNAVNNTSITTIFDATANQNNATIINNSLLTGQTQNFLAGSPVTSGSTIPNIPTTTTLITYELGDTANPLTAATEGTGLLWYTTETRGTGTTTAPTPNTSAIGLTSYWVSSTNAYGCESERIEIVVNVEDTLGVQEVEDLKDIHIYPNPTSGHVSINFPNALESKITVYDLNGRLLLNTTETTTKSIIDLSNYEDGVYLLKIEVNQNEIIKRVVKY